MKKIIPTLLLLAAPGAYAANIVSDPYPPAGNQPDECAYIEGTMAPVVSPVESVTGGVRCKINVDAVAVGPHTFKIFAKSAVWGDSTQVNFTFTAGKPLLPGGLRIIP